MSQMPPDPHLIDEPLRDLLAPVPGDDPCGVSLRGESLFTDIRLARDEDDPTLPMRQWERPLKKADWACIERICRDALVARSKDLQLAAWLTEAWTRQDSGLAGLARGLLLLRELVALYWEGLHPRRDPPQEGGGWESRVAPLDWLGERMAHTVRVHVCLLPLVDRKPASITLDHWERLVSRELSAQSGEWSSQEDDSESLLTRNAVVCDVLENQPQVIAQHLADVREAQSHLDELSVLLKDRLGPDAPNLRKLAATLDAVQRVLMQLASEMPEPPGLQPDPDLPPDPDDRDLIAAAPQDDTSPPTADSAQTTQPPPVQSGAWSHRDEAYRTLEALADYLAAIEPHSPTPYLIRRAVNWGRLPLPDLMAEIMREEGDLNRLVQLLGLSR